MDIVLSPTQHDRLVDTLLDTSLATQGRASLDCGPGLPLHKVEDAWRDLCVALPTTRLFISRDDDRTPGFAVSERIATVQSGTAAPDAAQDIDPKGPLCRLYAVVNAGTVTRLVLDYSHLALDDRSADLHAATPLVDETRELPRPGSRVRRDLAPELLAAVDRVASERGAPRSWLVLLAWAVVVARFRGGERSAIGVLLDSRPAGLEDAIGVYESTLPLVVGLDRRPPRAWLADQVTAVGELISHAHVSRAERNELSGRSRTVDLFDSSFDLRPQPEAAGGLPGPVVAFTVGLHESTLVADYDATIVADDVAARLLDCVVVALTALASGHRSTADIELLDDTQRHEVQRHNATAAAYPNDRCLHHLVEDQADRTPDAVALGYDGRTMTYAELNRRANRLAHDLIARGARPDSIIGLCAEPGFALCVGILGSLKAGAAYAPLDPSFPPDRLDYLYHDLNCSIILVERDLLPLLPADERRNVVLDPPDAFAGWPEANPVVDVTVTNQVATLHFVPAMLQTFLSSPQARRCTTLRHVFVSGEPVPASLARRFRERLDADLINLYGVTEVSIDSTYYVCPRTDDLPFVRSGTPISNTRTYVLDESLQPVPFGARGAVFIAGDSVTRGYLGRPGLTAYRFVPDPFRGQGARMYRTGDVAQLLPDGHLRFLGRVDPQEKLRGIRVGLLEVAAEINALPAGRESLIVPFGEGADRGLVAYVIPEDGAAIDVVELRAFLAGRMPPYMVPNAIILLDGFPLNSNGKVDRAALPDPALVARMAGGEHDRPARPGHRTAGSAGRPGEPGAGRGRAECRLRRGPRRSSNACGPCRRRSAPSP